MELLQSEVIKISSDGFGALKTAVEIIKIGLVFHHQIFIDVNTISLIGEDPVKI